MVADKRQERAGGKRGLQIDGALRQPTLQSGPPRGDRCQQVRPAIDTAKHHPALALAHQAADCAVQRRRVGDGVVEGDPAVGVDQHGGVGEHPVGAVHASIQVVHQHRPWDRVFPMMATRVLLLLFERLVGSDTRPGMALSHQYGREGDDVSPPRVQLLQWLDRADIDGSAEGTEVQQHRPPTLSAEAPRLPFGVWKVHGRCPITRRDAAELPGPDGLMDEMARAKARVVVGMNVGGAHGPPCYKNGTARRDCYRSS
jgi:hypothetical protein